eukprot:4779087-Prymnesium_polylepis.1
MARSRSWTTSPASCRTWSPRRRQSRCPAPVRALRTAVHRRGHAHRAVRHDGRAANASRVSSCGRRQAARASALTPS